MKTQMEVKTRDRFAQTIAGSMAAKNTLERNRCAMAFVSRGCACLALLSLLAVGGYLGAKPREIQRTLATVVQVSMIQSGFQEYEDILAQYEADRRSQTAMLDSVIDDELVDAETKRKALEQKTQLAERMETETAVISALAHMGIEKAAALCGAGMITLIIPHGEIENEDDSLRVVDAAAAIAQVDASEVKIILAKK